MTHLYTITALNLQARAHTKIGISPKEAARLDPEAFLQFAEEVARVARKLREPRQMDLFGKESARDS